MFRPTLITWFALGLLAASSSACDRPRDVARPTVRDDGARPHEATNVDTVEVSEEIEARGRIRTDEVRTATVSDEAIGPCEVVAAPDGTGSVAATVFARVARWHVAAGQRARAGDPVVTLDARDVADERASWTRAQADLDDLHGRVAEEQRMIAEGASSARALREATSSLARAQASTEGAVRRLAAMGAPLHGRGGEFTLVAPVSGTLLRHEVPLGAAVNPGALLGTMVDLARLRIAVHLSEEVPAPADGSTALVTLRGFATPRSGHVTDRTFQLDPGTRNRTVFVTLDQHDDLVIDQSGTARIGSGSTATSPVVAARAVYREGAHATVFVRTAPRRYSARPVLLGHERDGLVEVLSGVQTGDPVVVEGTFLLASEWVRRRDGFQAP